MTNDDEPRELTFQIGGTGNFETRSGQHINLELDSAAPASRSQAIKPVHSSIPTMRFSTVATITALVGAAGSSAQVASPMDLLNYVGQL